MPKHRTWLRTKYQGQTPLTRPFFIDEQAWDLFRAHVYGGRTLQEISDETGLSCTHIRQIIVRVDHDLGLPRDGGLNARDLNVHSPVEDLALSTRGRNALHQLGCRTVADALRFDFAQPLPRLGQKTRQEILTALVRHGFVSPASLPEPAVVQQLNRSLTSLREQVEVTFRRWHEQIEGLEAKVRKLSDGAS